MSKGSCRFCGEELSTIFVDLGISPLANSYVESVSQKEIMYPLRTYVCEHCFLVQVEDFETQSIFLVSMLILAVIRIVG